MSWNNDKDHHGSTAFRASFEDSRGAVERVVDGKDEASTLYLGPGRLRGQHDNVAPQQHSPVESVEDGGLLDQRQRSRDLLVATNLHAGTGLPHVDETESAESAKSEPVSWRALPRKDQLFIMTLARLSEPLTQSSLGSYLFYQLQSFDPSLPDSTVAYQAGIIQAAFPFAQFLTAMMWGQFADSKYGGRKRVICIGLIGTMCSIIGFGFSHNFAVAVFFRFVGGILNGNIGVMRTMISEIIKEKKYQSRAFLLMPMTFNIGVIVGPILGMPFPGFSTTITKLKQAGFLRTRCGVIPPSSAKAPLLAARTVYFG
jgi:hypothetical protein